MDLIRVGGADVEGSFVSSGPAVVADKLPDSNPSKALGVRYLTEYEKVYGKGSANQFGAHAFDVNRAAAEDRADGAEEGQAGHAGVPRRR